MSGDRYAKPVHVVEEDALNRASFAVGQDDGFIDQLFLGSLQFPEDVEGSLFASHHGFENSGGDRAMHPAAAIDPTSPTLLGVDLEPGSRAMGCSPKAILSEETMHRTALACAFAGAVMACNVASLHAAPLPTNVAAMKSMVADSSIQVRWHWGWRHRGWGLARSWEWNQEPAAFAFGYSRPYHGYYWRRWRI
jgi:hypothetical protein